MAIIGFNFSTIHAERKGMPAGPMSVNNNLSLLDVQDAKLSMAQTKKGLRVTFAYTANYEPGVGKLALEGDVILLEDAKAAEIILAEWGKTKKLPQPLSSQLLNHILDRCNIQVLIMARDIALPSPIPLPKVNFQQSAEKAAPKAEEKAKPKKK